nr:GAF domain-containing protein [Naasia lichenicola]
MVRVPRRILGPDVSFPQTRAAAAQALAPLILGGTWPLDEVVTMACSSFDVNAATVSVIDGGRLLHRAQTGVVPQRILLRESFTLAAIQEPDGMVVPDAAADPRFRRLPHVLGAPHIRFYAGFPLESAEGGRIGSLNLFDPSPRPFEQPSRWLHLLRLYGVLAQLDLHRSASVRPPH